MESPRNSRRSLFWPPALRWVMASSSRAGSLKAWPRRRLKALRELLTDILLSDVLSASRRPAHDGPCRRWHGGSLDASYAAEAGQAAIPVHPDREGTTDDVLL